MSRPHLILGIDPGLRGAAAVYEPATKSLITAFDLPTTQSQDGKKTIIDLYRLATVIGAYAPRIKFAMIEDVGAMPRDGVVGAFTFGRAAGGVHGVIAANHVPVLFTKPSVWKSATGLSADKALSRRRATELFPLQAHLFKRVKDDGKAESALLAVFGERFFNLDRIRTEKLFS